MTTTPISLEAELIALVTEIDHFSEDGFYTYVTFESGRRDLEAFWWFNAYVTFRGEDILRAKGYFPSIEAALPTIRSFVRDMHAATSQGKIKAFRHAVSTLIENFENTSDDLDPHIAALQTVFTSAGNLLPPPSNEELLDDHIPF